MGCRHAQEHPLHQHWQFGDVLLDRTAHIAIVVTLQRPLTEVSRVAYLRPPRLFGMIPP